jgi:hypothetical protein
VWKEECQQHVKAREGGGGYKCRVAGEASQECSCLAAATGWKAERQHDGGWWVGMDIWRSGQQSNKQVCDSSSQWVISIALATWWARTNAERAGSKVEVLRQQTFANPLLAHVTVFAACYQIHAPGHTWSHAPFERHEITRNGVRVCAEEPTATSAAGYI